MKKVLFLATLILSSLSFSQVTTNVNLTIPLNVTVSPEVTNMIEFDVDNDGIKDFRLTYWANHQYGITSVCELLLLNNGLYQGCSIDGSTGLLRSCDNQNGIFDAIVGYVYTSDITNNLSGFKNFPFKINSGESVILRTEITSTEIKILSYTYYPTATFNCTTRIVKIRN